MKSLFHSHMINKWIVSVETGSKECGVGEDYRESLGLQGDQTSQS